MAPQVLCVVIWLKSIELRIVHSARTISTYCVCLSEARYVLLLCVIESIVVQKHIQKLKQHILIPKRHNRSFKDSQYVTYDRSQNDMMRERDVNYVCPRLKVAWVFLE